MVRFGWENVQSLCGVVFYQTDISLFRSGAFGDLRKINSQINGRSFVFQHAGDLSERYITPKVSKGVADLLIFACNGDVCPVLVVTDDHSVDDWTGRLNALGIGARVASIPSSSTDGRTQGDLCDLIDELCLVRGPARYHRTNFFRIFGRKTKGNVSDEMPPLHD